MLPYGINVHTPSFKYANIAIPELINRMLKMGSAKKNLKAKVFGGSDIAVTNNSFGIGRRNIAIARTILKDENIPVISHSVGGQHGRKVLFYTATGNVLISYIKRDIKSLDQQINNFNPI
jgi:chemotaxis protein CheD